MSSSLITAFFIIYYQRRGMHMFCLFIRQNPRSRKSSKRASKQILLLSLSLARADREMSQIRGQAPFPGVEIRSIVIQKGKLGTCLDK